MHMPQLASQRPGALHPSQVDRCRAIRSRPRSAVPINACMAGRHSMWFESHPAQAACCALFSSSEYLQQVLRSASRRHGGWDCRLRCRTASMVCRRRCRRPGSATQLPPWASDRVNYRMTVFRAIRLPIKVSQSPSRAAGKYSRLALLRQTVQRLAQPHPLCPERRPQAARDPGRNGGQHRIPKRDSQQAAPKAEPRSRQPLRELSRTARLKGSNSRLRMN